MKQITRYRITGSIFLLSVGFILIVLMLEPPSLEEKNITSIDITLEDIPDFLPYKEVVPASDVVELVEKLKSQVDQDGYSTDHGTLFGQPVLLPWSSSTESYAVQAGSFKVLENATKFRDDLREVGYEAFISSKRIEDEQIMHRVAVGPFLKKDDAEAMREALEARVSSSARVMEFSI